MTLLERFQKKTQTFLEITNILRDCNKMIEHGAKVESIRAMLSMAVHFYGTYEIAQVIHDYVEYRPLLQCL